MPPVPGCWPRSCCADPRPWVSCGRGRSGWSTSPRSADVQEELDVLAGHPDGLVRLLSRRPGQKEDRWQQTVAAPWSGGAGGADRSGTVGGIEVPVVEAGGAWSEVDASEPPAEDRAGTPIGPAPTQPSGRPDELRDLREEVSSLRDAVSALRQDLEELRTGLGG